MNNESYNRAAMERYRKQLIGLCDDISKVDINILNKAVGEGLTVTRNSTPVVSGYLRRGWKMTPAVRKGGTTTKRIFTVVDYAPHVNYPRRIKNKAGQTIGYTKGRFMIEKGLNATKKAMAKYFQEEIRRLKATHGANH